MVADGPIVREFEAEFAAFCGVDHGVATSNGTTALQTAFEALDLGGGDRILTTPFSFIASANAIQLCGAEPVFADIDPETYNLDPDAVVETIETYDGAIDAILAVHLYGLPADVERLREIAAEYDLLLIEDAAQAHGATVSETRVGAFGDAACFSFYPTKNMTTGEGGMVVTDDGHVADRAARFVNHGRSDTYEHVDVGHNFRLTSIAAAIGRAQLEKLPAYVEARRENAARLTAGLADTPVETPIEPADRRHVYHQYTIRTERRDELLEHLDAHDIGAGIYYPVAIHEQPAYDAFDVSAPIAEAATEEVLSIPVHPSINEHDIDRIVDAVRGFF
ncbi:DegT/DnrJ/EryC1/StrS family aminotransferase [Natronomonas salsuginis]|uniref:DegT/DnrJ/EryC1/StrS family aminotransferase n=2 Tax=Natronomonas salsuginis TaxID=2217661 RepID=A0A4V5ZP00_9EURY|nr:DegT/DnrJ/EryC1/StrS family aminotransferase [Natronomonas salsuginis]